MSIRVGTCYIGRTGHRRPGRLRGPKAGTGHVRFVIRGRWTTESMDVTWVTERVALGGGIWNIRNMAELAASGVTHVIDMQIEFDDTPLGDEVGVKVLWNPTDDDFLPKPSALLERGVDFALAALDEPATRVFIHCAAGVHRAPMMTLALLCAQGWDMNKAMTLIESMRPSADFADVYVESVRQFLGSRQPSAVSHQPRPPDSPLR